MGMIFSLDGLLKKPNQKVEDNHCTISEGKCISKLTSFVQFENLFRVVVSLTTCLCKQV